MFQSKFIYKTGCKLMSVGDGQVENIKNMSHYWNSKLLNTVITNYFELLEYIQQLYSWVCVYIYISKENETIREYMCGIYVHSSLVYNSYDKKANLMSIK